MPYDNAPMSAAIRSRMVPHVNGLTMHVLEAGPQDAPALLLLHGFPELAYSWRKVMPALAAAGYRVIAPDQRGYGCTTGWENGYDADLHPFRLLGIARDALGLLHALGVPHVEAVIGHDFGSPVAAWCALTRPDVFRAVALMSAPFAGPPALTDGAPAPASTIHDDLAALDRPRKHYQWYYSTPEADADMRDAPQGLHAFLRAYYHMKSADWAGNRPYRLAGWRAEELAKMPTYYIMDHAATMAESVEAPDAPAPWLTDAELAVYAAEFARTGFQGGLQWYRCGTSGAFNGDLQLYAGRPIEVPACFISGASDWGVYQKPGDFEAMQTTACANFRGAQLIEGAGHWVQQEQPEATVARLLDFLGGL
jgi:pimeloyl-ACP methyl ester carboxylesterase